jgi:hypothetical protein
MTQNLPVTAGQKYEISFWARADELAEQASKVGVIEPSDGAGLDFVTLRSGTYDWTQYKLSVTALVDSLPLSIWCQGSGEVFLDDLEITAENGD